MQRLIFLLTLTLARHLSSTAYRLFGRAMLLYLALRQEEMLLPKAGSRCIAPWWEGSARQPPLQMA